MHNAKFSFSVCLSLSRLLSWVCFYRPTFCMFNHPGLDSSEASAHVSLIKPSGIADARFFYRPDALPDTQPMMLMYWRYNNVSLCVLVVIYILPHFYTVSWVTGRAALSPFLSPNQQCQSNEGKISHPTDLLTPSSPGDFPTLSLVTNSSWLPLGGLPCLSYISRLMPVPLQEWHLACTNLALAISFFGLPSRDRV